MTARQLAKAEPGRICRLYGGGPSDFTLWIDEWANIEARVQAYFDAKRKREENTMTIPITDGWAHWSHQKRCLSACRVCSLHANFRSFLRAKR